MNKKKRKTVSIIVIPFIFILLVSVFLILSHGKSGHRDANVILIVSDALRYDILGCYGGDANTPNIDRLAKMGILFENAYSTAPCTMPSAISLTTGNYSRTYSLTFNKKTKNSKRKYIHYVHKKEKLLAKKLRETGFDVKMDIENNLASCANNFQGFEEFRQIEELSEAEIGFVENRIPIRKSGRSKEYIPAFRYYRVYDLLHYVLTVPEDRNFFIVKWFMDPHAPYDPPGRFKKRIPAAHDTLPQGEDFYSKSYVQSFNELLRAGKFSEREVAYIKALYKAEVESVDERVGYILEALKQRKLRDKTFIVFTSDHGEAFMEHGHLGHGYRFYENLAHVPLIFTGPGIQAGHREKATVSHLDLMATIRDLMRIRDFEHMQGKSYSGLFTGRPIRERAPYFDRASNTIDYKNSNRDSLLMKGYKLIVDKRNDKNIFELYNLIDDRGEQKNIAAEKPAILQELFKRIMDLREQNKKRLEKNIAKIDKSVELDAEWQKTMEELKALGYI